MQDALLGRLKALHEPKWPKNHVIVPVYPVIPLREDVANPGISLTDVKDAVARYYKLRHSKVYRSGRQNAIERQIAMYLCVELTGKSTTLIGAALERDRSSVSHGHKKIRKLIAAGDIRVSNDVAALTRKLCGE